MELNCLIVVSDKMAAPSSVPQRHRQLADALQADLHTLANEAKKKSPPVKLVLIDGRGCDCIAPT